MAQKRSKLAKIFVYLALAAVLIGVIAPFVTYFGVEYFNGDNCPEGYILNEETGECEEATTDENGNIIDTSNLNNEELCTEAGGTWYEENQICILPDAE